MDYFKRLFFSKKFLLALVFFLLAIIFYLLLASNKVVINPVTEKNAMDKLEATKQTVTITQFSTDGCSGNLSNSWNDIMSQLVNVSDEFRARYSDVTSLPFESVCIIHDEAYHAGEGGYLSRLNADRALRASIIDYAITNRAEIQHRLNFEHEEQVLFAYELLANAMYRAVRLGGAPCSGQPYAWGYGYNQGICVE